MAYKERHGYTFDFFAKDGWAIGSQRLVTTHRLPDRELYDRAAGFMPDGTAQANVSEDGEEIFEMFRVTRHGWKVTKGDGFDKPYTT